MMSTAEQKVMERIYRNRGLQKRAGWGRVLTGTAGTGLAGWGFYSDPKNSFRGYQMGGRGGAEDLGGYMGEGGYVQGTPSYLDNIIENSLYFVPYVGWPLADAYGVARHNERYRKPTDRYYKMRESLARAGIEVGRNGSKQGIINNVGGARHRNPNFTKAQKEKLLSNFIDPETGAPMKDWRKGFDARDYQTKADQMIIWNAVLGGLNKVKLAPSGIMPEVTGLATGARQERDIERIMSPGFNLRGSLGQQ